ncbi:MAG TPA: F0F1 ATP synthase subunit B [Streptosporangiaceae bacterium]|jgi:F-type H+-transporting ATPase subunit b|nr:F0F1 ATP synthase subunit B [Streptosporangiaceae bacterium]
MTPSSVVAQENNFLIPNATIFVEVVLFFIFLWVLSKWVLPPITKALAERQETIRARLIEAEEAKKSLASAEADYQRALADARHEAARIREEARGQGAALIADARQRAQEEAQGILDEARRQITADRERAFGELRTEIGAIATELAGRVVGEPVTGDAEQIERYLADSTSGSRVRTD